MTSSSTDTARAAARPPFLTADRGSWVRLAVVLAFAVAALVAPFVGSTQAQFTDHATVEIRYQVGPTSTPTPTADPTVDPTADPTTDPAADGPTAASRTAPQSVPPATTDRTADADPRPKGPRGPGTWLPRGVTSDGRG